MYSYLFSYRLYKQMYSLKSKLISLITILTIWLLFLTRERLYLCIFGASFYAIIELLWYKYNEKKYFTTVEQYIGNVIYMPVMIDLYIYMICDRNMRIVLFPINCWLFEIIFGYYLIYLFRHNKAWRYNDAYTLFHGNVSLACFPRWILLGIVVEIIYPIFFV
ncbi:MAG: hypothetical protein Faunusvirus22_7 [Faunusvirus sp.]|jgi:hypothetical protein|uniref:Uncharacterized protein n=1 Tax=Faunusvirus sp. TaxID=2487766 RepID=A0A3G4ZXC8_9VIRU|nr:MAG: hypothetical protein Faunusvirus22_7 [Faunusvirus sp.]